MQTLWLAANAIFSKATNKGGDKREERKKGGRLFIGILGYVVQIWLFFSHTQRNWTTFPTKKDTEIKAFRDCSLNPSREKLNTKK